MCSVNRIYDKVLSGSIIKIHFLLSNEPCIRKLMRQPFDQEILNLLITVRHEVICTLLLDIQTACVSHHIACFKDSRSHILIVSVHVFPLLLFFSDSSRNDFL